jgi:predicted nucleotidyltransferase
MGDMERDRLLTSLRSLRSTSERRGVTSMSLFGSRARGDNRPDSDVDLVIEVMAPRHLSLFDLVGIGHEVEDSLGLSANIFMRRSLDGQFLSLVRRDEIRLF